MELAWVDILSFTAFFVVTVGTALYKSRKERDLTAEEAAKKLRGLVPTDTSQM